MHESKPWYHLRHSYLTALIPGWAKLPLMQQVSEKLKHQKELNIFRNMVTTNNS